MSELSEKVIRSNGCHDCIFLFFSNESEDESCKLNEKLFCSPFAIANERHNKCPLHKQSVKVVIA